MQKTKIEIIDETVEFYGTDLKRRSIDKNSYCVYNGENGTHCAVARCVSEPKKLSQFEGQNVKPMNFDIISSFFKEDYKGHELDFWKLIQSLHDCLKFWNYGKGNGLTLDGEKFVNELKNRYR